LQNLQEYETCRILRPHYHQLLKDNIIALIAHKSFPREESGKDTNVNTRSLPGVPIQGVAGLLQNRKTLFDINDLCIVIETREKPVPMPGAMAPSQGAILYYAI
jgi:hypothetical protein